MATSPFSSSPTYEHVYEPPDPADRVLTEFNPVRLPGKHPVKPWPPSAEREWETAGFKPVWELPDVSYDAMRAWVARVEAGEPEALALAQERKIRVVTRNPAGKRDEFHDPNHVFHDISDAIHGEDFDDPEDRDGSNAGYVRRYELRMQKGREIIKEIFGDDFAIFGGNRVEVILWITQDCYEAHGDISYEMSSQAVRAHARLNLGIANKRDHAIRAIGLDYWN